MRTWIAVIPLLFSTSVNAIDYNTKNHLNVGLNTFYRDYSEVLVYPKKSDERGMLYGVVIEYERKAPQSVMFLIDLDLAGGNTHYDGSLQNFYGEYAGPKDSTTSNAFINIDTKLGYTFLKNCKHLITPFVGLGVSGWGRGLGNDDDSSSYAEIYTWDYFSYGLQYDYNPNRQWQYGLHATLMTMLAGYMQISDYDDVSLQLGNKTHFEVSAPVIYRRNVDSKNYWRFTPYYQYQAFGASDYALVHASYFYTVYMREPASHTHIAGLKVEFGIGL